MKRNAATQLSALRRNAEAAGNAAAVASIERAAGVKDSPAVADLESLPSKFLRRWEDYGGCREWWEPEYRFHPDRDWRFDFAMPHRMAAVELHGGAYTNGRHVRGPGFTEDRRKMNAAVAMGWKIHELTTEMLDEPEQMRLVFAAVGLMPRGLRPPAPSAAPAEGGPK